MTTYALNGFGRIGKLALKSLLDRWSKFARYFEAGVKKVVMTAPVKNGDATSIVDAPSTGRR